MSEIKAMQTTELKRQLTLQVSDEQGNRYPFLDLSFFKAWLVYKDKRDRQFRKSIETQTTILQLITGKSNELKLDREFGYNKLLRLIDKDKEKLKIARIYPVNGSRVFYDQNFETGESSTEVKPPNFNSENKFKVYDFEVITGQKLRVFY